MLNSIGYRARFYMWRREQIDHQLVSRLGYNLGMAFQYQDDLLDIESNDETLGKPTRSDQEKDKLNAVKVNGLSKVNLCGTILRYCGFYNRSNKRQYLRAKVFDPLA